ncbi:MAG: methionine adenosyltransferase [Alphaproteobacteria bacterium]|nr:methionine adenosyltransferase [Alphaproteobacteria bacterium]
MATPRSEYIFTSESVSEGHPDKICDQISDMILDMFLHENPEARVAVETMATTNRVIVAGETRGADNVTPEKIEQAIRDHVRKIGYEQEGFHWETLKVENFIHRQSVEIAQGVDASGDKEEGAGDQGIMFGYACDETSELMPATVSVANRILRSMAKARHNGEEPLLEPDAKSQVSLQYDNRTNKPVRATSIVVSTQHKAGVSQQQIREIVRPYVLAALPDPSWMCPEEEFYVNPTGTFVIGGPDGDAGLTGRKIIVDTYGGAAPHGGGAFSGKDPTKVDRSAAYAARYLAKNVVGAGLATGCTIQISYAIGVSHPISFYVNTHGTGTVPEAELEAVLPQLMNLSPYGIRKHLNLNRPIYLPSASYGHFGRTPRGNGAFSWEKLDLVDALLKHFNLQDVAAL